MFRNFGQGTKNSCHFCMGKLPTARNSSISSNHMKACINLQQIDGYQPVGQGQREEARTLFQRSANTHSIDWVNIGSRTRNASIKIFAFHVVTNETWIYLQWPLRSRDCSSLIFYQLILIHWSFVITFLNKKKPPHSKFLHTGHSWSSFQSHV
jgi:hypothetical protein